MDVDSYKPDPHDHTTLIAHGLNGDNSRFNSRIHLWNPSPRAAQLEVRIFSIPVIGGNSTPLGRVIMSPLAGNSGILLRLAEDVLIPAGITLPYEENGGNLIVEVTIEAPGVQGGAQLIDAHTNLPLSNVTLTESKGNFVEQREEPDKQMEDSQSLKPQIFRTAFETYRTEGTLGTGGSGTVFKAANDAQEMFAIKLLNPECIESTSKVRRFKNELFFSLRSDHPNLIRVLDYGLIERGSDWLPFYVLPYYDSTLRHLMRNGVTAANVLPYFFQILDAVEAAHFKGVWHRDLKPENILHDTQKDLLVLADFGIAHFTEEQLCTEVETRKGDRLANFQYSAPEQRARRQDVDGRADIFALGLILNELFTGEVIQGTRFKKIVEISPEYAYVDQVVEEMVSQSRDDRPAIGTIKQRVLGRSGFS